MSLGTSYRKLFTASSISNLGDGVGQLAYPWLASAVTRNPILIALVAVAQRLPWLVFTLPAGVITDRLDRRRIMVAANGGRAVLTGGVAIAVLWRGGALPGPDELDMVGETELVLYLCVVVATLLLGVGEVLYDNSAQTIMPALVATDDLEKANGRLWAAESVTNQFLGPPLGSLLLAIGFAVPFFVDAGTFAVSAALIFAISATPPRSEPAPRRPWRVELREGFGWLWHHDLLRPMAIVLGGLNGLGAVSAAVLVLFSQEVLGTSATEFAVLSTAGAVGGVLGGWTASWVSKRIGSGPSLWVTMLGGAGTSAVIGAVSLWPIVWLMFGFYAFSAVLWNVITVSLRQSIIPDRLLGRVNSVYRFFAWGAIPIGAMVGGLVVAVTDAFAGREIALRTPWFVAALGQLLLLMYAAPRLTTAAMDKARADAVTARGQTTPSR
ncbi:MAG: MFS transporter [Acidimicrobiia bacterium]|jgi:MFS family permease|nr:MFS transporter [Acidimicrobiia bacterium]MDQ3390917.1 MFS transporter [Actinomycetota bacterium]